MFIRIVWKAGGALRGLRRPMSPPRRQLDDLGICVRDFEKMTRSLFDRQD
ncbi:hypothetical protein [Pelagibacterium lacus]|nr:hypothetical protein [Pelagibacterium lacus]